MHFTVGRLSLSAALSSCTCFSDYLSLRTTFSDCLRRGQSHTYCPANIYRYKGKQNISIFPIKSRKILLYSKVCENITFSASLSTDILFISSYLSLCNTLSERDKLSGRTTFSERDTFSTTLSIHNKRFGVSASIMLYYSTTKTELAPEYWFSARYCAIPFIHNTTLPTS